jgi:hypothetical protein
MSRPEQHGFTARPDAPSALAALQVGFADGDLTPVEHVESVLQRLRHDPHSTVVALDEERALRDAAALGAELRQRGPRSPLHGVAIRVKDLIDVVGLPTRTGSASGRTRHRPAPTQPPRPRPHHRRIVLGASCRVRRRSPQTHHRRRYRRQRVHSRRTVRRARSQTQVGAVSKRGVFPLSPSLEPRRTPHRRPVHSPRRLGGTRPDGAAGPGWAAPTDARRRALRSVLGPKPTRAFALAEARVAHALDAAEIQVVPVSTPESASSPPRTCRSWEVRPMRCTLGRSPSGQRITSPPPRPA